MLISLLTTSKVLSIFLPTPSAAMPCAWSACSSISTISFHDIPSKFGVYLCSLSERSHIVTSFSTAGSTSSSFFAPLFLRMRTMISPLAESRRGIRSDPVRRAHQAHQLQRSLNPPRPARPTCLQQRRSLRRAVPPATCPR